MRVRNVQAHAARACRADFQIQARAHFFHRAQKQNDMAHQLRHGLRNQQRLERVLRGLEQIIQCRDARVQCLQRLFQLRARVVGRGGVVLRGRVQLIRQMRQRINFAKQRIHFLPRNHRCRVRVLITDGGGSVDRVHDYVRLVCAQNLRQARAFVRRIQIAKQVIVQGAAARGRLEQVAAAHLCKFRTHKSVTPFADPFGIWKFFFQQFQGIADFFLIQRSNHHLARFNFAGNSARYLKTHQARAAEKQKYMISHVSPLRF